MHRSYSTSWWGEWIGTIIIQKAGETTTGSGAQAVTRPNLNPDAIIPLIGDEYRCRTSSGSGSLASRITGIKRAGKNPKWKPKKAKTGAPSVPALPSAPSGSGQGTQQGKSQKTKRGKRGGKGGKQSANATVAANAAGPSSQLLHQIGESVAPRSSSLPPPQLSFFHRHTIDFEGMGPINGLRRGHVLRCLQRQRVREQP